MARCSWRQLPRCLAGLGKNPGKHPSTFCSWRLAFNDSRFTHSGLKIEHYPCWRVVAGVYLATRPSVYTTVHEPVRHLRREQKVIESHAFVLRPPFIFVIPECPERPVRM